MNIVQRFQTKDGREFKDEAKAKQHERLIDECEAIMAPLGPIPKLGNGQSKPHDLETFRRVRAEMVRLAAREIGHPEWKKLAFENCQHGIIGRYLDDSNATLYGFWGRLMRFDHRGREFSQPYYAIESVKKGVPVQTYES
jgi:hypothetical protein